MASVHSQSVEELKKLVNLNSQIVENLQKITNYGSIKKKNSDGETLRLTIEERNEIIHDVVVGLHSRYNPETGRMEKILTNGFVMLLSVVFLVLLIVLIIAICSNSLHFYKHV